MIEYNSYYNPPDVPFRVAAVNTMSLFHSCAVLSEKRAFCTKAKVTDTPNG